MRRAGEAILEDPHLSVAEPVLLARAFWFLRHGETDWNARGVSQGNVDVPLNATGMAQAHAAAALLRHRGIAALVASPLSRTRVTAEIVAPETVTEAGVAGTAGISTAGGTAAIAFWPKGPIGPVPALAETQACAEGWSGNR